MNMIEGLQHTTESIETALKEIAVVMCKEEGIDAKGKELGEIRELVKEHGFKLRQHATKGTGKHDLVVGILLSKDNKIVQVGRVTLDLNIKEQEDSEEWAIKVEGGMLTAEGVEDANKGFGEWVNNRASI